MTFCLYAVIACGMKEVLGMQRKRENGCLQTAVEACLDIRFGQDTQLEDVGGDTWQKKKVEGQLARWALGGCGQGAAVGVHLGLSDGEWVFSGCGRCIRLKA